MKVKDIKEYLNDLYPFSDKCEWDNCGLIVGDENREVVRIGFVLDLTKETLNDALYNGVDLVITHHPVIFNAQKNFLAGNIAFDAAVKGLSVISCHTCYDSAKGGVSEILAEKIGLTDIKVVETHEKPNCVRSGKIDKTEPAEFAKLVSKALGAAVRYSQGFKDIENVAVCGGAGGDFISEVVSSGADAYVTGDIDHHEFLLARDMGLTLIAAGHFETEDIAMENLVEKVSFGFPKAECIRLRQDAPVKFIFAEEN